MLDDCQDTRYYPGMDDIEPTEFPFVAEMPKREQSKIAKVFERWNEVRRIAAKTGMPLTQGFCAMLAGVSRQRIDQLVVDGRLTRIKLGYQSFITEVSFEAWLESERKNGRPLKAPEGKTKRVLKATGEAWRDMLKKRNT